MDNTDDQPEPADGAWLDVKHDDERNITTVTLRMSASLENSVSRDFLGGEAIDRRPVMKFDFANHTMSIFPQRTHYADDLYQQKYTNVREIVFDLEEDADPPTGHYDALSFIEKLPSGFIRLPSYGLGFVKEMRPVLSAIEELDEIRRIRITSAGDTRVEGDTFIFNEGYFALLRSQMARITRGYQRESLKDRTILGYNETLHRVFPERFPFKERPYDSGLLYRFFGNPRSNRAKLSKQDRKTIVAAFSANAVDIAKRDAKEFIQLQKDIELVSLDRLIMAVEKRIERNSKEGVWQNLLELNPFILSMLFGQPIVVLQGGAHVGAANLSGDGARIADFLGKNPLSQNAVLVEIKRPKTDLLGAQYRNNLWSPSPKLTGAVTQVLDQRVNLISDIARIARRSKLNNLEVTYVDCVVVAGTTPETEERRHSFELYRNQLRDVRIITFDEMLERLNILRLLLSGERYTPDDDEDEDTEGDEFGDFDGGDDEANDDDAIDVDNEDDDL